MLSNLLLFHTGNTKTVAVNMSTPRGVDIIQSVPEFDMKPGNGDKLVLTHYD